MAQTELLVSGNLDVAKTIANINASIKKIESQIKELKIKATLDKSAANKINAEISALNKQKRQLYVDLKIRKKDLKSEFKEIQKQNDFKLNFDTTNATSNINKIKGALSDTNVSAVTLGSTLKNALNSVGLYTTAYQALNMVRTMIKEVNQTAEEMDKYVTEIKTVAEVDDSKAKEMLSDYTDTALQYKVDISDVEKSAITIMRAGKSLEESGQYLESSLKLSKSAFMDSDKAAENLVVIGNSYNLTADKLEDVTNTLLYLDSHAKVTASELSKGVATAGKSAEMAGIGYQKLASMISVISSNTEKTESGAAVAINRMLARSYNVKLHNWLDEAAADGTSEEDVKKSINDFEKALSKIKIKIRDSKEEFRDFEDIMSELSPRFHELSSVDQAAVTSALGGAQYKNTVKALIDNWNTVIELEQQAANATDVTESKYSAYLESMQAKNAEMETSLKNLWSDLVPSDTVKDIKAVTVEVIKFVDEYQILQTLIRTVTMVAVAKGFIAIKNGLHGTVTNLNNFNTAMNITKTSSALTATQINTLGAACKGLSDKQLLAVLSSKNLSTAERLAALQAAGLSKAEATAKLETLGLAGAETTAAAATTSLRGSLGGLWQVLKTNPLGLIITGVTAVISVISIYKQKQEEAAEAAKKAKQALEEAVNSAKAEKDTINDLVSQYEAFRDVTNLTADDKETLKGIQDKLIETFGLEADGLDLVNGKYDDQIAKLKKLSYEKLKQQENTYIANMENAKSEFSDNKANEVRFKNDYSIEGTSKELSKKIIDRLSKINGFEIAKYKMVSSGLSGYRYKKTDSDSKNFNYGDLIISSNLNSAEKVKAISQALDDLKEIGATGEPIFQKLVNWLNHYQEEADNANKSFEEMANLYIALYESGNNISLKDLSATEYNNAVNELLETIPEKEKEVKEAAQSILDTMFKTSVINSDKSLSNAVNEESENLETAIDNYDKTIDDYLKIKSKIETAMKSQYTDGKISIDVAFELSKEGYADAISKDDAGNYVLLTDKIKELASARNADTIAALQEAKASALAAKQQELLDLKSLSSQTKVQSIDDVRRYEAKLAEIQSDMQKIADDYDFKISFFANPELVIDEKELKKQAEQAAKEAKDIVNDAYSKDRAEADHMLAMDEITEKEYYQKLLELLNKHYKDKEGFLDEYRKYEEEIYKYLKNQKIKIIDDEIDRLKTVNEEKQTEIDLEKKRQALENAKKQKNVKVFDSERGWINETNRENVQKAQEDYNKAVTDKQVSELEAVKKAIENGVNTLHSDNNEYIDIQSQVDSIQPNFENGKVISSISELLQKLNIPYDAEKSESSKALDEMVENMGNSNATLKSILNDINNTVNNYNQNLNNQNAINIHIDKVVADNPQRFADQMSKVVAKDFTKHFENHMNQFGKELQLYKANHR